MICDEIPYIVLMDIIIQTGVQADRRSDTRIDKMQWARAQITTQVHKYKRGSALLLKWNDVTKPEVIRELISASLSWARPNWLSICGRLSQIADRETDISSDLEE